MIDLIKKTGTACVREGSQMFITVYSGLWSDGRRGVWCEAIARDNLITLSQGHG